jgi:hypothetical protein
VFSGELEDADTEREAGGSDEQGLQGAGDDDVGMKGNDAEALATITPHPRCAKRRRLFVRPHDLLDEETFEGIDAVSSSRSRNDGSPSGACWDCDSEGASEEEVGGRVKKGLRGEKSKRRGKKKCKFLDDEADASGESEGGDEEEGTEWQDDGFIALTQAMTQRTPAVDERAMYLRSLRTPESEDAGMLRRAMEIEAACDSWGEDSEEGGSGGEGSEEGDDDDIDL